MLAPILKCKDQLILYTSNSHSAMIGQHRIHICGSMSSLHGTLSYDDPYTPGQSSVFIPNDITNSVDRSGFFEGVEGDVFFVCKPSLYQVSSCTRFMLQVKFLFK